MQAKRDWNDKIEEIIEFATKNDYSISYSTVVDILKNKEDLIEE